MVSLQLHLIRHAKTEKISKSGSDFDRSLLPKGIKQAMALANYLERKQNFDLVMCSEARRTLETKHILNEKLNFHSYMDSRGLYLANEMEILKLICQQNNPKNICIIGHNDGISELASYLTGQPVYMKTSAYVCLSPSIEHWSHLTANCCLISDAFRPEVEG
jgi:phosphohistidine phosphatase